MTPTLRPAHVGKLISGILTNRTAAGWAWLAPGGGYHQHQGFFEVHWEVHDTDENDVRLHVESPKQTVDTLLNDLKSEMVLAFLDNEIKASVSRLGFQYKRGRRISDGMVRRNKCTEPFRVQLSDIQSAGSPELNIEVVHAGLGPIIDGVVQRFSPRLDEYFRTGLKL